MVVVDVQTTQRRDVLSREFIDIGGPLIQDRIWFVTSYRRWAYNDILPRVKTAAGQPFPASNLSQAAPMRITTQLTPSNKLSVAFEKTGKERDGRPCGSTTTRRPS